MPTKPKQHKEQLLFNNIFQNPPENCSHSRNSTAEVLTEATKTKAQHGSGYFCCEAHLFIITVLLSVFINGSLVPFPEIQIHVHSPEMGASPTACPGGAAGSQKCLSPPGSQWGSQPLTHRFTPHHDILENFKHSFDFCFSFPFGYFFFSFMQRRLKINCSFCQSVQFECVILQGVNAYIAGEVPTPQ